MTELRFTTLTIPASDLGPENPLPPLRQGRGLHAMEPIPGIPDDMLERMAFGRVPSVLPYTIQDGYARDLHPRDFHVAVIENDVLRATFLLEFGGRMWSLYHKQYNRDLLDVNPVLQPANLALRNAWFSGGVEWNIGTTGHSPFTCSPLFAASVDLPDGSQLLRMYEWERIRGVPFQIDVVLPEHSPVLFVYVRIANPHDETVPMYWWSNIAVPETTGTRVVVPAASAYSFGYDRRGLHRVTIPEIDGIDVTYPVHIPRAADFFFDIPDDSRKSIAALDAEGRGLVQVSTGRLLGRKLFVWGMGQGGRRWQTFLAKAGHAYLEIQAGLARTQMEHVPMPAHAIWSWQEAYGYIEADPAIVHGADWDACRRAVAAEIDRLVPAPALDAQLARSDARAEQAITQIVQRGSGWGALEAIRCRAENELPMVTRGLAFDDPSLGEAQAPWLSLLTEGVFPATDPAAPPVGFMIQPAWRERLEALAAAQHANWSAWFHLGIMRYYAGERDGARQAWLRSMEIAPNAWAARNLALLAFEDGQVEPATEYTLAALRLQPDLLPLAIDSGQRLTAMGRWDVWLRVLDTMPPAVRSNGRVRLLEGWAALETGDLDRVQALFGTPFVVEDLREGERSLSELWTAYHVRRLSLRESVPVSEALIERARREFPVPDVLDFRMS